MRYKLDCITVKLTYALEVSPGGMSVDTTFAKTISTLSISLDTEIL